jgi:hypothetical protein
MFIDNPYAPNSDANDSGFIEMAEVPDKNVEPMSNHEKSHDIPSNLQGE